MTYIYKYIYIYIYKNTNISYFAYSKPALLKGVYALGFNAPSRIQETALPTLLADPPQNMIAQSQSGTGKTAAFVLAMLSRVDVMKEYPQVLCLSPTYELAIQTGEVAAKMSRFCPEIKIKYAVRGEEISRGSKISEHIIIGTPGKVLDWGQKFKFFDLSKISVFVLDEADVMIATQGHQDQCIRIHKLLPRLCQMMFFSATYEPEVMNFAEIIVSNPLIIRLLREEESLDNIKQYYIRCKNVDEKYTAITNIYGVITIGQAIIFCHTKKTASWLAGQMTKDGHAVAILSGDLTVEQRISVLDRFRAGLEKVLITTNVLARVLNLNKIKVTCEINFNWSNVTPYENKIQQIDRVAFLLSPKPGALTAATCSPIFKRLTTRVDKASPSTSSAIMTRGLRCEFANSKAEKERVLELDFGSFTGVDKVWRNVTSVKLHSLYDLKFVDERFAIFHSDHTFLPDLLHSVRDQVTDGFVTVSGYRCHLSDFFGCCDRFAQNFQFIFDFIYC
ncbi:DEAD-box helicase Dbp80 [Trachymyrmex zeteki]|uniref:RNA helicase n=1 Tax=Mycetomoellerius zeteki TaxID=64791 RepID=A0A151WGM3_9HYME|nr:DEAD-box helicase Dbp80 [Trachymyrmex zeteki]